MSELDLLRELIEIQKSNRLASWIGAGAALAAVAISTVAITLALF